MNDHLKEMLKKYDIKNEIDKKNAIKEIIQEVSLYCLSKSGFFKEAAFYGGTALRIFYGLDRFSEDLDFSLIKKDNNFNLSKYLLVLKKELKAFGLSFDMIEKEKTKESNIKSAFLKANTNELLLIFYESLSQKVSRNEVVKIKFEIDVNPPDFATFEIKYLLQPLPYEIQLYDEASLFAGKIHAILMRNWKNRVKGRDLYDYVFYLSKFIKYNHKHLCERLYESGLQEARGFNIEDIKNLLLKRFEKIDFEGAKKDVLPFIKDIEKLDIWSKNFFKYITSNLKEV